MPNKDEESIKIHTKKGCRRIELLIPKAMKKGEEKRNWYNPKELK